LIFRNMQLITKYIRFVFLLLCVVSSMGYSQTDHTKHPVLLGSNITYNQEFPATMLNERSVVFVNIPPKTKRNPENAFIKKAHEAFKNAGIDPVAYYFTKDVTASQQVRAMVANDLSSRKIKNLILLDQTSSGNPGSFNYSMILTQFSENPDFVSSGQSAWKASSTDLDQVLLKLNRNAGNSGLEKENLLIVDEPDFFYDVNIIRGKRFETFNSDLKIDKLAVPKFIISETPGNLALSQSQEEQINPNTGIYSDEELNSELKMIMSGYPYKYELVSYSPEEEEKLWNEGYQYILLRLHAPGKTIKRFLDYEFDDTETDFVTVKKLENGSTVLKTIPVNGMVYKYYVKHIYTGDIYLGTHWDADESWQEALNNHIMGFKSELNIK